MWDYHMRKYRRLTDEEKNEILNLYTKEKLNCSQIARKYGAHPSNISIILKKNKISVRPATNQKYSADYNYFDIIDTPEKAYFLGFLYADGCNFEPRSNIIIVLKESDKDHLNKLKHLIKSNHPIGYRKRMELDANRENQVRLSITNQHMSRQLSKLGCGQAKSLIIKFPNINQVPTHLIPHFVRGHFDGDGSLFSHLPHGKNRIVLQYGIGIIGTLDFVQKLQDICIKFLNVRGSICGKNSLPHLSIAGRHNIKLFLDWIYKDSTIHLTRKHEKYLEFQRHCVAIESKPHYNCKPVLQIDLEGNVVRKWKSSLLASLETGIPKQQISNVLTGRNKTAHGFKWQYDQEYKKDKL